VLREWTVSVIIQPPIQNQDATAAATSFGHVETPSTSRKTSPGLSSACPGTHATILRFSFCPVKGDINLRWFEHCTILPQPENLQQGSQKVDPVSLSNKSRSLLGKFPVSERDKA
jgi:hypothetical protein